MIRSDTDRWRLATVARVRGLVARAVLCSGSAPPADDLHTDPAARTLGAVTLRPHQAEAVARLRRSLDRHGGALLADSVGLGKTFTALALARDYRAPLVVAPASLRGMWADATRTAGAHARFVSTESLSRPSAGAGIAPRADLVVVDEAHHFRHPGRRRYAALARLARDARVLLLTATPIHNRAADLDALLALFVGSRAPSLDEAVRASMIVRRGRDGAGAWAGLPRPSGAEPLPLHVRAGVADMIVSLPPPLPPSDGGVAGALAHHVLLRAWASSAGALRAGLQRRIARAEALVAALDSGHLLSRAEVARWTPGAGSVQPVFPELLGAFADDGAPADDPDAARAALLAHLDGLRALAGAIGRETDDARAQLLRTVRQRHPGERVVAFSQFADTVRAYFAALRTDAGVCALTARDATVAGGRLRRDEALARFAPRAHDVPEPHEAERIGLLISTDVASEGLDLSDASVVVHLDLPWTPARLEQRVGRLVRPGARHARVATYFVEPPPELRDRLGVERTLDRKTDTARRIVSRSAAPSIRPEVAPRTPDDAILTSRVPAPGARDGRSDGGAGAMEAAERLWRLMQSWDVGHREVGAPAAASAAISMGTVSAHGREATLVAAVAGAAGSSEGWIAVVAGGGTRAVSCASPESPVTDDPASLLAVAESARAEPSVPPPPHLVEDALAAAGRWACDRLAREAVGVEPAAVVHVQGRILARVSAAVRDAPLHRRSAIAAAAAGARRALRRPVGAEAERRLLALAAAEMDAERWLEAVADVAGARESRHVAPDPPVVPHVVALLVVRATPACHPTLAPARAGPCGTSWPDCDAAAGANGCTPA